MVAGKLQKQGRKVGFQYRFKLVIFCERYAHLNLADQFQLPGLR